MRRQIKRSPLLESLEDRLALNGAGAAGCGAVVSAAAKSETPPGFKNHGAYVSSVAHACNEQQDGDDDGDNGNHGNGNNGNHGEGNNGNHGEGNNGQGKAKGKLKG